MTVPNYTIKNQAIFSELNKTIKALLDRLYGMTLQKSVVDQLLAAVRNMARSAIMNQELIDEIVERFWKALRYKQEFSLRISYSPTK